MQAAAESVSWLAAQPSVLGRCGGGGAPSAPARGTARGGGVRAVGVARCCARTQEKRPPRVRKTKEERRELVESFINNYRVSNGGKFPSVNLTHKEVGGSYYIVREIVRDIIQENRVLGPGGLNATALSFEDCPDSSELSMKHELDVSNGTQARNDSASGISNTEESLSLQNNGISTQTLLGSSNLLEAAVLNRVVENGSAAATAFFRTSLEDEDGVSSEKSREIDLNSSEEHAPSFAYVSDSDKHTASDNFGDAHEVPTSSVTDGVIPAPEPSTVYETNGALLTEHKTLGNDSHGGTTDRVVSEENVLVKTNGALQTQEASLHEHETLPESVSSADAQIIDDQTVSACPVDGFNLNTHSPEAEDTTKTVEQSKVHGLQNEFEQSLLDASLDEKKSSNSIVSHPALHTEGSLQVEDKHSLLQADESELKKSLSEITKEEVMASDARYEQGMGTTATISRRTSKAQQKKEDNLFWLVLRAFVIAVSKLWTK